MVREFFDVVQRALLLCGLAAALLSLATGALGCAPLSTAQTGPTVQLDPDVDDRLGGTGIESRDIRAASEKVSRSILAMNQRGARIAMMPVVNKTRFRIDAGLLQNRLTYDIVKKARGKFELIPLTGELDGTVADYVLETELRSELKDNMRGTKSDYVQYAFTLKRPTDGAVLWVEMHETKRMSDVDVIYQ